MSTIRKESKMKLRLFKERGQALILIALAGIALFGITGLAIDGSAKFSDRRHAQNAADTAALAGALALARSEANWELNALNRAMDNGYDDNHLSNEVEVYNPPISGTFSDCSDVHFDCNDYVQVIVTSHIDTWFMRVLGFQQTTNIVQAVASKYSASDAYNIGGNAVVALAPDGCALTSQGGTDLAVVGGGLFSNSADKTCSFKKQSCKGVTDIDTDSVTKNPGTITTVGNMAVNTGCPPSAVLVPQGTKQLPFPPPWKELETPVECSQPQSYPNSKTVVLTPGYYDAMPPNPNMTDITLDPGVYCIGSGDMRIGSKTTLRVAGSGTFGVGPGVLLYFKPGGEFDIAGGSTVQLWGINQTNVNLDLDLESYKGFLIYAAPNYAEVPVKCAINGGSDSDFKGTIYAPNCVLTLNGGSDDSGFETQLIAYNVDFSGTSDINLNYDAGSSPVWDIPLQVGLSR
jgi:hypothetical protein